MPERRFLSRPQQLVERWLSLLTEFLLEIFSWRPTTLLGYLVAVALLGILLAVALITGVKLHILHRLL